MSNKHTSQPTQPQSQTQHHYQASKMMSVHHHYTSYSTPSTPSPPPFYSQPSSPAAAQTSKQAAAPPLQHSTSLKCRPKLPHKKPSCSTRDKRADVQSNLEMKVEKAKGFHAFFVPLGKSLPPAPPSSPVLGGAQHTHQADRAAGTKDYFEDWVEDVGRKVGGQGSAMDLD